MGESTMTKEQVEVETRRLAEQAAAAENLSRAHVELGAARQRAEQTHKDKMERPMLVDDVTADADKGDILEGGLGHGKKHNVPTRSATRSTTAGRSSAASSSTAGATPKVKQRLLKRHDSAGSDCRKCLESDFMGAEDDKDEQRLGRDKEVVTDAEMIAESEPHWMIVLPAMMDAQTDKVMRSRSGSTGTARRRAASSRASRSGSTRSTATRKRISRASKNACRRGR